MFLHDIREDARSAYDEVAKHFNPAVTGRVAALTKDSAPPKNLPMGDVLDWLQKIHGVVPMARLTGRIVNLAPPPLDWDKEKIKAYR